ncbi:hypothetical protein MG293_020377 [Ovis ammon polii]|uniref:Uncharacterized protein n=1 Tax=Ovis ammon polii TaxID=230172 RepID=A0AAD4TP46_OVIAM|nr:hypothetical protein MG293_020377 [Ovis ammon polii]KAI4550453.1 hypothetical protein MJT46_018618 [Ovis ammon polii x Ovis aries]
MKKTRSTTLRRAWPSSDFSDRASDRMRSRSEKDYRLHKRFPAAFAPQASRGYMTSGISTDTKREAGGGQVALFSSTDLYNAFRRISHGAHSYLSWHSVIMITVSFFAKELLCCCQFCKLVLRA